MRMRWFKLHTREYPVYELAKENYLTKTKKDKRYSAVGKDQCKRDFAVCPACDNPIQIIGVYKSWKIPINLMDVIIIMIQL